VTNETHPFKIVRTVQQDVVVLQHRFDVRDSKGRMVGAQIKTFVRDLVSYEEGSNEHYYFSSRPPGRYYCFEPRSLRDYKPYGASQKTRYFSLIEARYGAVSVYLDAARERAKKLSKRRRRP
jgi:hypothetical protein